jgi:hypothetical protein
MAKLRIAACCSVVALLSGLVSAAPEQKAAAPAETTVEYDIRNMVENLDSEFLRPTAWNAFGEDALRRNLEPAQRAALLVRMIYQWVGALSTKDMPGGIKEVQVMNATRLLIRATPAAHEEIKRCLSYARRTGDIAVGVKTHLYEIDEAFYTRIRTANAKPGDWEEEEKRQGKLLTDGKPLKPNPLFAAVDKLKPVLSYEMKSNTSALATLLSRHQARTFLPSREQVRQHETQQVVLEGVAFLASMRVSPDRRCVRLQFAEKSTEVLQVKKGKVVTDNEGKEVSTEVPFLKAESHGREFEIADGGSILIAVHYRPEELKKKNRWWVLRIDPRIYIREEEQERRALDLKAITPLLVADVLKNPRLKATRAFYGTPDDRRFALLDSAEWNWPKDLKVEVAGFERADAKRAGNRLLGIRVEGDAPRFKVTLVNAGGDANGAVIGTCTIHYRVELSEKVTKVDLDEPADK